VRSCTPAHGVSRKKAHTTRQKTKQVAPTQVTPHSTGYTEPIEPQPRWRSAQRHRQDPRGSTLWDSCRHSWPTAIDASRAPSPVDHPEYLTTTPPSLAGLPTHTRFPDLATLLPAAANHLTRCWPPACNNMANTTPCQATCAPFLLVCFLLLITTLATRKAHESCAARVSALS